MTSCSTNPALCRLFVTILLISLIANVIVCLPIKPKAIILVDPCAVQISGNVENICKSRGIEVIDVLSPYMCGYYANTKGRAVPKKLVAPRPGDEGHWAKRYKDKTLCCALTESDAGIATAERIQVALGLPGNGEKPQHRNKFLMNEACRDAGLATFKQCLTGNWTVAKTFLTELFESRESAPTRCIIKPVRGVAGDGVFLCDSLTDAKNAFYMLQGKPTYGGGRNSEVLVEEFGEGQEYGVDTVSRNGLTKVVALWKIIKRPANCAPFVFQCTEIVAADSNETNAVVDYCLAALKANKFQWGPAHTEIVLTDEGPKLIEINPRWHTTDNVPIVSAAGCYDALTATVDAFTDPEAFAKIPDRPTKLLAAGRIVHLISFVSGDVTRVKHTDTILHMKSVKHLCLHSDVGDDIRKTVDTHTDSGYVLLSHKDSKIVDDDYNEILHLQPFMFDVERVEGTSWIPDCDEACDVDYDDINFGHVDVTPVSVKTSKRAMIKKGFKKFAKKSRLMWRRVARKTLPIAKSALFLVGAAMFLASMAATMLGFNVKAGFPRITQ